MDPSDSPIRQRYLLLRPIMDERLRRLWAAAEALALGIGGVSLLSGATGLSRTTIRTGIDELRGTETELRDPATSGRIRRPGAGRKAVVERDETLEKDLEALLESCQEAEARLLDWTCKSLRTLCEELSPNGHRISYRTIGNLLHRKGFCFSASESYKKFSLASRREQYRLLSRIASWFLRLDDPVVSLRLSQSAGGKDGTSQLQSIKPERRTVDFAAAILRHWWRQSGSRKYPRTKRLLVIADTSGLSVGDRPLWAPCLQPLADEAGLEITAAHIPPGARRWRRSVHELTSSLSTPGTARAGEALMLDLDLILFPEGETSRRGAARQSPEIARDGFWNYRCEPRAKSSAGQ